ncbi:hypothetical protein Poli38472_001184 [Pythium oligandrum]|uniref:RRM domain-containing protein n=1 Tax=Pythium oligandrum TaxID=41045 RepID=A0A8K1FSY6_PYTOL|nr:hypothetical protein Poli38472_001184 [Pythium oligandrum]|eukprot:TMW69028.1 hypothetical protein Poli38472_001184 [Pythium oligandrum]
MAELDDEFARFQAELASLEQQLDAPTEDAPTETNKRARDEEEAAKTTPEPPKKAAKTEAQPVVIAAKPKIYSAPPRAAPLRASVIDSVVDEADALSSVAAGGALSGFPVGTSGEYAATAGIPSTSRSQMPVARVDMVTGEFLSAEEQQLMNQQQSVYEYNPYKAARGAGAAHGKGKKNLRMAGGEIWEDATLADWPDNDFRLFVGDLGNEVNDEILAHAFSRYASFQRARVVRDKYTHKTRGYGFVSFGDHMDCAKAMREMNGKYIGNRPVKIQKSNWQDRNIDVARKKAKKKKHHLFG